MDPGAAGHDKQGENMIFIYAENDLDITFEDIETAQAWAKKLAKKLKKLSA